MFKNISLKFKAKKAKSSSKNYSLIIISSVSVAIFLIILIFTYELLLALIAGISSFFLLYYSFDGFSLNKKTLKDKEYETGKIKFYKSFLIYSTLENDYLIGFNKAIASLNISELKDSLLNYQEADFEGKIPIKDTNSLVENEIIDILYFTIHEKKETDYNTIERLKNLIDQKQDELKMLEISNFQSTNIILAIYLLSFTLAFSLK